MSHLRRRSTVRTLCVVGSRGIPLVGGQFAYVLHRGGSTAETRRPPPPERARSRVGSW